MTLGRQIAERAPSQGLRVLGTAPVMPGDGLHESIRSVVLLGPDEPAFWPRTSVAPEFLDGAANPVDRWSRRVIGGLACDLKAKAYFPFGGAPYRPFLSWALRSGRCWSSPVGLLVHDTAGLFVSFRGAIGLTDEASPVEGHSPCDSCLHQPCRTACPPGALTPDGYDVPACRAWLDTGAGAVCRTGGCLVRRACPVGAGRRMAAQSAHHMEAFHPA